MNSFNSLEPAIDPGNKPSFLLDWELTMKCNLDCSYCDELGHNNKTKHPPLEECLRSIDFMYAYVDRYMDRKPNWTRSVILNVYGGEALHHPDIITILKAVKDKYQQYKDRWHLTVTCTTNAVVSERRMADIIEYIDEFTVSFHAEANSLQHETVRQNLLAIQTAGRRVKCVIMMLPAKFEYGQDMIAFCETNNIKYLPKQIDHYPELTQFNYTAKQTEWFEKFVWRPKGKVIGITLVKDQEDNIDLDSSGRACCGGRSLCADGDHKDRLYYVDNRFTDWYCSVNWFFLFVKQLTGDVYVNKDCQMRFDGTVGPIGNISQADAIIENIDFDSVIQCKKDKCYCGICAPKAQTLDSYNNIMGKHHKPINT